METNHPRRKGREKKKLLFKKIDDFKQVCDWRAACRLTKLKKKIFVVTPFEGVASVVRQLLQPLLKIKLDRSDAQRTR
jgi:hypothetical protein